MRESLTESKDIKVHFQESDQFIVFYVLHLQTPTVSGADRLDEMKENVLLKVICALKTSHFCTDEKTFCLYMSDEKCF